MMIIALAGYSGYNGFRTITRTVSGLLQERF